MSDIEDRRLECLKLASILNPNQWVSTEELIAEGSKLMSFVEDGARQAADAAPAVAPVPWASALPKVRDSAHDPE